MNSIIEIKNLTKTYFISKKINVLKGINLKFYPGKIYSISGPSGSGKSTLLNLISLIDKPTIGSIKINGDQINHDNNREKDLYRSKNIGIIYQEKNLLSDFTALENVLLARLTHDNNKSKAMFHAKNMIRKVGLEKRLNHYPSQLSGGEAQRIAISRALINSPNIILADEPTGSLDQKNAGEIFKLLISLKNKNRVIIFATHNRYFANMSDCKLKVINGKVITSNDRI